MKTVKKNDKIKKADKYEAYRDKRNDNKEKPANFCGTARKLLSLLKGKEVAVAFTVVCTAVSAVLSILGPKYLGDIINVLDVQVKNKLSTG